MMNTAWDIGTNGMIVIAYADTYGQLLYFRPGRRTRELRAEGYRLCHNRSARKHRRQGHYVFCVGRGLYAWKVKP